MIPGKIIRFLEERANIAFAAARDRDLVPYGHRVCGWQTDATGTALIAFIPSSTATRLVETLLENGRIAVTFEEVGTHETYQLKGRYLSHRPVNPTEIDVASRTRERLAKAVRSLFGDDRQAAAMKASIPTPSLAVEIAVQEVFLQTPGPGAGSRLAPPAEAEPGAR
jgi:hypothetical protein